MKEQNEKQAIEEMAALMDGACDVIPLGECYTVDCNKCKAALLYNAGCRKQSAVIDEFAKRLKEKMNDLSRMEYNCVPYFLVSKSFIDKIAAEMKGGAE